MPNKTCKAKILEFKALMHTGEAKTSGGRAGDAVAENLSDSLAACGFRLARFKTGTPCRLDAAPSRCASN